MNRIGSGLFAVSDFPFPSTDFSISGRGNVRSQYLRNEVQIRFQSQLRLNERLDCTNAYTRRLARTKII